MAVPRFRGEPQDLAVGALDAGVADDAPGYHTQVHTHSFRFDCRQTPVNPDSIRYRWISGPQRQSLKCKLKSHADGQNRTAHSCN
jgi:hypothetical protein